ncbi:MAG: hypothetical protein QW683_08695 [Candidatus Caldarchaeum sp.]
MDIEINVETETETLYQSGVDKVIDAEIVPSDPGYVLIKDLEAELGVSRPTLRKVLTALGIEAITRPQSGRALTVTEVEADLIRNRIAGSAIQVGEAPSVPDFGSYLAGLEIDADLAVEGLESAERVAGQTQQNLVQIASQAGESQAKAALGAYAQSAVKTLVEGKGEIDAALAKYLGKR